MIRPGRDAGMVTAETAVVLPALVLLFASLMGVLAAETAQIRCVDAAGEAARSAAAGVPLATVTAEARRTLPGAVVTVHSGDGLITATVAAPVPHLPGLLKEITVADSATALLSGAAGR